MSISASRRLLYSVMATLVAAALAIAFGGGSVAGAQSGVVSGTSGHPVCTVSPSSASTGQAVTANGSGSTSTGGTTISTYKFYWGDGSTTGPQASPTATHKYSSSGVFTVQLTIFGNFGPDGHETDECTPQVTIGGQTPPPGCSPSGVPSDSDHDCEVEPPPSTHHHHHHHHHHNNG